MSKSHHLAILNLMFSSVVFMISGYFIHIYIGRILGPVEYGLYGVIITLVSLINVILYSGISQSLSKFISENEKQVFNILKTALFIQITISIIISVAFYSSSELIASILKDPTLIPYLQLSSLIFPLYGIYSIFYGYYNGIHNFSKQATINHIFSISKVVTIIGFSIFLKLYGALIGFIISPLIAIFYAFKIPSKETKLFPSKPLIFFALPLVGFAFFSLAQQTIDIFFVKAMLPSGLDTGYYTANQNIARLPFYALSTIATVLFPSISKNVALKLHQESRTLIHQALRFILLLLIPITALISATSDSVIQILYSSIYLPAAPALSILIVGFAFLTMFMIFANIINGAGKPYISLYLSIIGVIITSICSMLLVPSYNIVGAALSTTIGALVTMSCSGYLVYKHFNALVNPKRLVKICFASLIIFLLGRYISINHWFLPVVYFTLGLIYFGILVLLKEITKADMKYINNFIRKKDDN